MHLDIDLRKKTNTMITREELEAILDDDNNSEVFSKENEDHDVIAIKLLRDRIPYDVEWQINLFIKI